MALAAESEGHVRVDEEGWMESGIYGVVPPYVLVDEF